MWRRIPSSIFRAKWPPLSQTNRSFSLSFSSPALSCSPSLHSIQTRHHHSLFLHPAPHPSSLSFSSPLSSSLSPPSLRREMIFARNHSSSKHHHLDKEAEKSCRRITIVGLVVNLVLSLFKGAAGILGNSVALLSDAVHSLSDTSSDFITLWALKVGRRRPSIEHPYGYGKYESVGSLSVAVLMGVSALGMGWHSLSLLLEQSDHLPFLKDFLNSNETKQATTHVIEAPTSLALTAAVLSIISKEILYQISMVVGKRTNSSVVIANAVHHRSDALSSIVAVVGIAGSMYSGLIYADALAGIGVSGMVLWASYGIGRDSLQDLTDKRVCETIISPCRELVESIPDVKKLHRLRARGTGPFLTMDVDIVPKFRFAALSPNMSLSYAHLIAEQVRLQLMDSNDRIRDVVVHVDPHGHFHLPIPLLESYHEHERENKQEGEEKQIEQMLTLRSHQEIEDDLNQVIKEHCPQVEEVTHIRAYFFDGKLEVQLEGTMNEGLTVKEAGEQAKVIRQLIHEKLDYIHDVDFHLELPREDESEIKRWQRKRLMRKWKKMREKKKRGEE